MALYRIKTVSKITNIPIDTIRNWEKRYDFLKPQISITGEKMYSNSDIELLRKITVLLKTGGRISEIASKVLDNHFLEQIEDESVKVGNEVKLMIEDYYHFLLELDLKKIEQIENLIEITVIFKNRIDFIYYPLMDRARQDSAKGIISLAQEHFLTGHILNKLKGFLSSSVFNHDSNKCSLICASPSSSLYEGGLLTLASSMKLKGYNIFYLGASVPVKEIIDFAKRLQPAVVSLSIHEPESLDLILSLFQDQIFPTCVGGLGVRLSDLEKKQHGSIILVENSGAIAVEKLESICIAYYDQFRRRS